MNTKTEAKHWERIADGVWKNNISGSLFERPKISGRWTFRSLNTKSVRLAKEELAKRITARSAGTEPTVVVKPTAVYVGDIIRRYQKDGYPDRQKQVRQGRTLEIEIRNCIVLLKFWDRFPADKISLVEFDRYHEWRKRHVKNGGGDRAVDMEFNTMSNAMLWAMRRDLIRVNPLAFRRPRYCCAKNVRHCREFMPHDTEDLHSIARRLFAVTRSETLGWQMLFEAFTGLRTCEALQLRTDAGPHEPGWITADGKSLCVRRAKNQQSVNPYVRVHEGLAAWLKAHKEWKQNRYPDSPWFFPRLRFCNESHADVCALTQSLRRLQKTIGRKITSHAMRAFYVTVRRSHGLPDIQIAWEIGHTSAGKTLASVYGGVPPHWLMEEGPKLKWLPDGQAPAWEAINSSPAAPQCPVQNTGAVAGCPHPASTVSSESGQAPVPPATLSPAVQSCPTTRIFSGSHPCMITTCSSPESPVTQN